MSILHKALAKLNRVRLRKLYRIQRQFSDFTMILPDQFVANLVLANNVRELPGAIVECGTWRGGMVAGIAKLLGSCRSY